MISTVCVALILLGSVEGVCKSGSLSAAEQVILDKHNALRALHFNTSALCYGESGDDITFTSQSWAESMAAALSMEHSTGDYGENLAYAGTTGTVADITAAYNSSTQAWYDEISDWDFSSSSGKDGTVTGHFTQVTIPPPYIFVR